ncbi:MAG: histidine phosphatase family protein [Pseudomonadota bacterium]
MAELLLVRHAQASFGAEDYDRLSPLGHQQAAWLGGHLHAHEPRFDRVLRGGLRRHRETFVGIARHFDSPPDQEDRRFDEFHYGPLEQAFLRRNGGQPCRTREDFLDLFPRVLAAWQAEELAVGESFAAFVARVESAVDSAVDAAHMAGGRCLIVTSGGVIGMVLRRVLGLDMRATADMLLNIRNSSLHRLVWEGGRLRLAQFNACPHLDPADRAAARTYV